MLKKLDNIIDFIEEKSFYILFSLMIIVVFAQVVCRYVVHSSLPWSEELSRYCMIWVVFIGVSAGIKAGSHMGVDALLLALPDRVRKVVELATKLITLIFCLIFFTVSLRYTIMLFNSGQKSATLFIPIAFAFMAIPIGFLGGALRSVQIIVTHIRNWKSPEKEHLELEV